MSVKIRIVSTLLGEAVFVGLVMRGQRFTVINDQEIPDLQVQENIIEVYASGYVQQADFQDLEPGDYRFWIHYQDVKLWRSVVLTIDGSDQLFRYTTMMVEGDDATQSETQLNDLISLPILSSAEDGVDDPAEANTITAIESLSLNIKSDYIRLNGEGYYGSRLVYENGGFDIAASTFSFE